MIVEHLDVNNGLGTARATQTHTPTYISTLTCIAVKAGGVEFAHVELQAYDSKHEDGEEEQQADLQQGDHSLHD